jgi:hypothetical protein
MATNWERRERERVEVWCCGELFVVHGTACRKEKGRVHFSSAFLLIFFVLRVQADREFHYSMQEVN